MTKWIPDQTTIAIKFGVGSEVLNKEQALGGAATSKRKLAVVIGTRETLAPWGSRRHSLTTHD